MKRMVIFSALIIMIIAAAFGAGTMAWFTAKAEAPENEFIAGTVMIESTSGMIFGIEREGDRSLYEIDLLTGAKRELFKTSTGDSSASYPNALAYDRKNSRLFYANNSGTLYYYDFASDSQTALSQLKGGISAGATFGRGYYWYIPQNANDLYRVSFDADGAIEKDEIFFENFTVNGDYLGGDIAMDMQDNVIYGSGSIGGTITYFKIDLSIPEYIELTTGPPHHMQLAFGSDSKLYGQRTSDNKWYEVGLEALNEPEELNWSPGGIAFNDLASNWQGNWNPGDCDIARFYVRNTGTKNSYIRFNWNESFWGFEPEVLDVVSIEPCDDEIWAVNPDAPDDGYLYYQGELSPNEEILLCIRICFSGDDAGNEYQGQVFTLKPVFEAIQTTHDASLDEWGWPGP